MKIITSILFSLVTFTILAQNPTYEQTVEYIKKNTVGRMIYEGPLDSYERATGHKLTNIIIENNGRIQLKTNQKHGIHDFDIVFNIFDLTSSIDYPDGIRAYKYIVHFKGLNVTKGFGITFATENDAIKVARAFRHLKTMCSQEDDLFGKPTQQEEKVTLTKSETFEYIKNIINNLPTYKTVTDDKYSKNSYDTRQYLTSTYFKFERDYYSLDKISAGVKYWEYKYEEDSETYYFNFLNNSLQEVELYQSSDYERSENDLKNYYVILLKTNKPIKSSYKHKETYSKKTKQEAKRSGWNSYYENERTATYKKEIMIYIKDESDAKRLKKAFEHLISLTKEEETTKKASDPFGG